MADQALRGIRVLELGRVLAAPFCAQMLADAGADVIKVELPHSGDESRAYGPPFVEDQSYYFLSLNRNKRSITLNLKLEAAREVLRTLIGTADVFLHNSLPGPMQRLGFAYDQVHAINPRTVYCAISSFGQSGPERDRPSLDMIAQAQSGIMSLTGEPDGRPMRAGVPVADIATGIVAAYGIMLALFQRQQTGEGQMVATSLVETSVAMLSYAAGRYFVTGETQARLGNAHASIVPYDSYRTADGWVTIAVVNESTWHRFCAAAGLEAIEHDPRFAGNAQRVQHRDALDHLVGVRLAQVSTADLVHRLAAEQVPHGEVRDIATVFDADQVRHLGLRQSTTHPRTGRVDFVRSPVTLSSSPEAVRYAPPYLGEHSAELLSEIGLDAEAIESLRRQGAV